MTTSYNGDMFSQWQIDDLVELVRRRYPEWDGFEHPPFVAEEIAYKRASVDKAQALIGAEEVRQLLSTWRYEELLNRLEHLGKDNNLLWNRVPRQGDLSILYRPGLDKAEFALQMQKLLYGRRPAPERVAAFAGYARRNYLPAKWTFTTYFLFLTQPEEELFVKPQVARWFLKFLGEGTSYTVRPSAEMYASLRQRAHGLRDALGTFGPRDMVDIQGFLWVCARESRARTGSLDLEGQVELEVPPRYEPTVSSAVLFDREEIDADAEAAREELPSVGDLLEPLFQAFKTLQGAALVAHLDERVADLLDLSPAARSVRHAPGQSSRTELAYRLGWARTRLKNRGLIERVERGFWQLTEEGEETDFVVDAGRAQELLDRPAQVSKEQEAGSFLLREPAPAYNAPYPLAQLVADTGYDEGTVRRWLQAIERKRQAIFYGPPGTGKTYLAQRLGRYLVGGGDGFVDVVQFHPAYAYEDFIQGIRPVTQADGSLSYEMVPGRFLQFCKAAEQREGRCVLIIDEINRANLARVFGELMYLLEYREETIPLAGGGTLSIPENVRLIGTMNTADRSIALVDHALRRRFAFVGLEPNYELLRRYHAERGGDFPAERLIALLRQLNRQIGDPHYAVGITYFLRPDLGEQMADVWRMEIEPYLEEYFFDRPEQVDAFRWERVKEKLEPPA